MSKCMVALIQSHDQWWSTLQIYHESHSAHILVNYYNSFPLAERYIWGWGGRIKALFAEWHWHCLPEIGCGPSESTHHDWACGLLTVPPSGSCWRRPLNPHQSSKPLLPVICMHFCPVVSRSLVKYIDWNRLGKGTPSMAMEKPPSMLGVDFPLQLLWGDSHCS